MRAKQQTLGCLARQPIWRGIKQQAGGGVGGYYPRYAEMKAYRENIK